MSTIPTTLLERLRFQAHIRRLINELGDTEAWNVIQAAVDREINRTQDAKKIHIPNTHG